MPAYSSKSDSLGAKLVTFYSQQMEGIPSHQAIVVVLDPRTGSLQAVSGYGVHHLIMCVVLSPQIVDGVEITNMRTAAASACAARVCCPHTSPQLTVFLIPVLLLRSC